MDVHSPQSISFLQSDAVRRWVSRAFIVSILVYLVVLGYLLYESVTGASKWAPYGVNMPLFVGLIIGSELVMLVTAVRIFREDSGIWPPAMSTAWARFKNESKLGGALDLLSAGWDISIIDLRLRTGSAILMGRLNRVASLVPLAYALIASAGGAPWGLRGSAFFDVAISLVVWAFMELVMVKPEEQTQAVTPAISANGASHTKEGSYSVRQVQMADLDRLEELEQRNWKDQAASRQVMAQRINTYPEGQIAAVYTTTSQGVPTRSKVVAWCSVMPANEQHANAFSSWDDLTSHGTLGACDPKGDVIVGVNLTSVTEGGTYVLLAEILAAVVDGGKDKLIGGSRLTGFVSFNQRRKAEGKEALSADDYARLREIRGLRLNEERLDHGEPPLADDAYRELAVRVREAAGQPPFADDDALDYVCSNVRGYMSIPGTRLVRVVADYFRDPASADYGVIIEWPNPIPRPARQVPFVKQFVASRIREEIAAEWEQRKQRLRDHAAKRHERAVPAYLQKTNGRVSEAGAIEAETEVEKKTPAGGA